MYTKDQIRELIGLCFSLLLWSAMGCIAYCFLSDIPTEEGPKTEISSVEENLRAELSSLNQEVDFLRKENEELTSRLKMKGESLTAYKEVKWRDLYYGLETKCNQDLEIESRTLTQVREEWDYMYFRLDEELSRKKEELDRCKATK